MLGLGRLVRWACGVQGKYWRNIKPLSRKKNIVISWFTGEKANARMLMFDREVRCAFLLLTPNLPFKLNYFYSCKRWNKFAALQELKVKLPECWSDTAATVRRRWVSEQRYAAPSHPLPHHRPGWAVGLWYWTGGSNHCKVRESKLRIPQLLIGHYHNRSRWRRGRDGK